MAARSAVRRTSFFQRLHPVAIRPEVCYTKKVASLANAARDLFSLVAAGQRPAGAMLLAVRKEEKNRTRIFTDLAPRSQRLHDPSVPSAKIRQIRVHPRPILSFVELRWRYQIERATD
jgi:hypothetical protein